MVTEGVDAEFGEVSRKINGQQVEVETSARVHTEVAQVEAVLSDEPLDGVVAGAEAQVESDAAVPRVLVFIAA